MRKVSLRWCMMWAVMAALLGVYGASAFTVTDFGSNPYDNQPPGGDGLFDEWKWELTLGTGEFVPVGTILVIDNGGKPWSNTGPWISPSQPSGWKFWKDTPDPLGVTKLQWEFIGGAAGDGLFTVKPILPVKNVAGQYSVNGGALTGSLNVPVAVPETGTLSLLAAGLLAGVLFRRRDRKKA